MTKRIYGGYDVTHNATAQGNRTVQSINGTGLFDAKGNMILDGYTAEELNELISVLPLSHYGTHTYLPAGVNGNFVGASENPTFRRVKCLLENDGTMVSLRAGTNGSSIGLYYSYLSDVLNATDINSSVNTVKQYQPGYITNTFKPIGAISSGPGVVVGQLMYIPTNNQKHPNWYTSFTNGTLDDTQHSGFIIPKNTAFPDGASPQFAMLGTDGYVYYFGIVESPTFSITVVRALYNKDTATFTTERLTGFTGSLFYPINNTNNITIGGKILSSTLADQPYALVSSTLSSFIYGVDYDLFAQQDTDGQIRFRLNGDAWATTASYNVRPQHGFSAVFNPSTKVVTIDQGYTTPGSAALSMIDTGTGIDVSGNVLVIDDSIYVHQGIVNIANSYIYTNTNSVICISVQNLQLPPIIQISHYNQDITPYNMLNFKQVKPDSTVKSGTMRESFGSAIGSNIIGLELLPGNSSKQVTTQGNGNNAISYAVHGQDPTFVFSSAVSGTINGYAPTTQRANVENNLTNRILISSISAGTVTTNGGILIDGIRLSTPLSYTSTLSSSGSISIDSTIMTNLKNTEFAKMTGFPMDTAKSKDLILFVPQQSDIPAFAILSTAGTDLSYIYRIIEVNVNTRVGNITSLSFKRLVVEGTSPSSINGTWTALPDSSTGMTIYDGGSFYFIGFTDPLTRKTIGDEVGFNFRGIVDKASAQISACSINGTYAPYSMNALPAALPNIGFGQFQQRDLGCKAAFYLYGTTIADYNAWGWKGPSYNVASQDVAQGFVVYFTEETPVLLSGKSFVLSPTSINLTTVTSNPANKTFHIYVRMEQGLAKYLISETAIAETGASAYNLLWIGTVTTNDIQIATINVKKRSRLDVFGESLEPAGSSFPVSYGLPSNLGTMNW